MNYLNYLIMSLRAQRGNLVLDWLAALAMREYWNLFLFYHASPLDFKTSMGFEIGSDNLSSFGDFPMLRPIS